MGPKKSIVPDAWDDDWETQADKLAAEPDPPAPEVRLSRAERKANHERANQQLWEDAETVKEQPLFLQAQQAPAYKSDFKPAMKVLARRPQPSIAPRGSLTTVMSDLKVEDDDDSEEEQRKKAAQEYEERKARAIREREEKQRRYQEAREKLFGPEDSKRPSSSGPVDGASRDSSRAKARNGKQDRTPRPTSSNDQSPARTGGQRKQLFDPNHTEKPASLYAQRKSNVDSGRSTPSEEKPIRAPRGPDANSGGFGFSLRDGKGSTVS